MVSAQHASPPAYKLSAGLRTPWPPYFPAAPHYLNHVPVGLDPSHDPLQI